MLRDEMLDLIAAIAEGITAGECVDAILSLPVEGWMITTKIVVKRNEFGSWSESDMYPATLQEVIDGKAKRMIERRSHENLNHSSNRRDTASQAGRKYVARGRG